MLRVDPYAARKLHCFSPNFLRMCVVSSFEGKRRVASPPPYMSYRDCRGHLRDLSGNAAAALEEAVPMAVVDRLAAKTFASHPGHVHARRPIFLQLDAVRPARRVREVRDLGALQHFSSSFGHDMRAEDGRPPKQSSQSHNAANSGEAGVGEELAAGGGLDQADDM